LLLIERGEPKLAVQVIFTAPPYADYIEEIATHPLVCGIRLNTVMPLKEGPVEAFERLSSFRVPLWVDLKGRQLRTVGAAIPPYTEIRISHPIQVHTPVEVFFSDGAKIAKIVAVDGDRLILADGPQRLIGPGESLNIIHPSLKVEGTLTETDKTYLEAMNASGMTRVMLSYVEELGDIEEVKDYLPDAELMLKIETKRGLAFARKHKDKHGRLIAARGDLFVEVLRPHKILPALQDIIQADPDAVVASRIFDSLAFHPVPTSADISDAAYLISLGYRTFLFGDAICFDRQTLIEALNLLESISGSLGK
jgi:pyruvate kinase